MPVGTGINHKAVISLFEIFPVEGKTEKEMVEFLKLQSKELDVEFLSYTAEGGVWKFRVQHFSSGDVALCSVCCVETAR